MENFMKKLGRNFYYSRYIIVKTMKKNTEKRMKKGMKKRMKKRKHNKHKIHNYTECRGI